MKTRITELLGIKYPIIQGAMAWVSLPPLVAAVSNAGGLGILGASFMRPDELRENIQEIKRLTRNPFAVNFMPENPELEKLLDVIIEEDVPVASYGKGDPRRIIERTLPHDIINLPTMGAIKHAIKAQQDGAHAVIVQGTEGGGHTGFISSSILVPMTAQSVTIPVVAAGGFGNGRGLLAALALGAEGISMGSRFIATKECPIPHLVKEWILNASEKDTVVTDNLTGIRCRVLKNEFSQRLIEMKEQKVSPWEMMKHARGRFKKAFLEGDLKEGSIACGQVAGLIDDIPSCKELIERIVKDAEEMIIPMKEKVLAS
ncbi:MAG: nitronate monooxygenase [Thermodesulfobacteriota bacterium]|nr:nitronate monooxygenase [Thermodesulfobacteriota bacterium]